MARPFKMTKQIWEQWMALDDALRADQQFTAAGLILINRDAEIAVTFNPALNDEERQTVLETLREEPLPSVPAK